MNRMDKQNLQDCMKPEESVTGTTIGCAFDVLNEQGSGFLESVYERSLQKGLQDEAQKGAQSRLQLSSANS